MKKFGAVIILVLFSIGCKKIELTPQESATQREIWNSPDYTLLLMKGGGLYLVKHQTSGLLGHRTSLCLPSIPCTHYSFEDTAIKAKGVEKIIRPTDKDYTRYAVDYILDR